MFGVPLKLFLIDAEDLLKEVGVVFDNGLTGFVDPAQSAFVFTGYFNAIDFGIVFLTVAKKAGGRESISGFRVNQLHIGKTAKMFVKLEDLWIEK